MQAFEIANGVASNGASTLQTMEPDAKLFRRRAIKAIGTAEARPVEWAVAELDGVRCYFDGTHAILTRQDLMP